MRQRNWKLTHEFKEILFEEYNHIAKITINRARYRNAFTPLTTLELSQAFSICREDANIRVVILTGAMSEVPEGKQLEDVKHAFCSGGDMHVKGRGGYVDQDGVPRLSVLDVQMQIRRLPKPWHVWWDRRRPVRFGSSASNTRLKRQSAWGWLIRWCLSRNWKILVWSGLKS